ncbi:MAG: ABC transporter substrate-binding protein [Planctomycetes bacterium]|nr:ABC transporter substrate-binding protein [Planctomycetota bacterium]
MKTSLSLFLLALAIVSFAALRAGQAGTVVVGSGSGALRILPTTSDQIDMLSELVAPARIVAMPEQALTWSRVAEDPAWTCLPTFPRFQAELVLDARADLVLVSPFAEPDSVARIRDCGLRVEELPIRRDLDDVIVALRRLGRLVGAEEAAEGLVADLIARRDRLLERLPPEGERPRALAYTNFGSGGWAAGRATTIDCAMRLAGLRNAVAGREGHFEFSFEELLAADPDLIVVSGAFGESEDGMVALLESEPALARAQAVIEGRILRLPPRLASAGSQELVAAAEFLAAEVRRLRSEGRLGSGR